MQGQDFLVPFGGAGHPGDCQKELAQQRETEVPEHPENGLLPQLDPSVSAIGISISILLKNRSYQLNPARKIPENSLFQALPNLLSQNRHIPHLPSAAVPGWTR
jgi:hypothetical protein